MTSREDLAEGIPVLKADVSTERHGSSPSGTNFNPLTQKIGKICFV